MKLCAFILSVHILLASLLPGMDTMELSKFQDLYKHYQLHKAQSALNNDVSFLDFLDQHYGQRKHTAHHHNHENLPFKSHHTCPDCTWFTLETQHQSVATLLIPQLSKHYFHYVSPFVASFFATIWQPPKIFV